MNKVTYLALVEKSSDGWFAISFPDLPGAHAQAKAMADIQPEATGALENFLYSAELASVAIASPSESLSLSPGQFAVIVTADMDAFKSRQDSRPVKKTVSLPAWMADKADRAGLSLSKVLQEELRSRLSRI